MKIFVDTSDLVQLHRWARDERIGGVTTNPSLMRRAGIKSYRNFASIVLGMANGKPVSFEILSDDFNEMERQARELASWSENVYVKIPITNTRGESSLSLINKLRDLHLNITAVMTIIQLEELKSVLDQSHILSVFAGRIADTGRDPSYMMRFARQGHAQLLWASAREILNVSQAEECGCDIITLTPDLLSKLELHGKPLAEYSLDTVKMFHEDGKEIVF